MFEYILSIKPKFLDSSRKYEDYELNARKYNWNSTHFLYSTYEFVTIYKGY